VQARDFTGLEPTDDPRRWRLRVWRGICSGQGPLYGGCGLGAAIEALEGCTGRPLVFATAQFLAFASPPSVVELEVHEIVRGHASSQVRVDATVDGEPIFTVVAAAGRRPFRGRGAWAVMPDVTPPEAAPLRPLREGQAGTVVDRLETRVAAFRPGGEQTGVRHDGRSALWVRLPRPDVSAAMLAVVGDFVPYGIGQALGRPTSGNSLDNTIRIARHDHRSEWILADVRVHAVADGFGHGLVHLWARDGALLATASQSAIVREWRPRSEGKAE
jgi:acyl-CoA thioesterase